MPRLMAEGQSLHAAAEATAVASSRRQPAVLAKLGGARTAPDHDTAAALAARPTPVIAQIEKPGPVPRPQSKPTSQPATFELASAESRPAPLRPAQVASLVARALPSANDIINQRDYWRGVQAADPAIAPATAPMGDTVPRPPAAIPTTGTVLASADPETTSSLAPWPLPERIDPRTGGALAYADPNQPVADKARSAPMGTTMGTSTARPIAPPDTTVAVKRVGDRPSVISSSLSAPVAAAPGVTRTGDQFNEPWLRAVIVSPSAQDFMSTSSFGLPDYRGLAPLLRKPPTTVMMTFSSDPQLGITARKFSGTAVVFVSTVTFGMRTASLW
jgi:hypothetical protein